jgi:REP element-mobilizing transposase RayT
MLRFYQRWLPHGRRDGRGTVYFVTWRLASGQRPLVAAERGIVSRAIHHRDGVLHHLLAFVVMDDHVHVLVEPLGVPLERLTHSWRSFTAHELQRLYRREGPIWQPESFDRIVRGEEELRQKAEYIVGNPWKRWPFVKSYPWVWEAGDDEPPR